MLEASSKINVIPPRASAQIDVRLLPGEDPARFVQSVKDVIGDASVEVESGVSFPASSSGEDTEFWRLLSRMAAARDPGVPVAALLSAGFTDCHFFREKGIPC